MTLRNYSSTAAQTTLSAGVDSSTSTLAVSATTGFPAVPFILAVDAGASAQELVLVTNVAGTNLTVTRGYDSTVAVSHEVGAVVSHSHGGIDFREANTHVNASSGVHGTTSPVVGTQDTQTLVNKTVSLGSNTVTGSKAQFNTALTDGDFATQDGTETLTNKTLSSSTNVFPWVIKKGTGTLTFPVSPSGQATLAVTFAAPFASAPSVVASVNDEAFVCAVKSVTTTGFTIAAYYTEGRLAPASYGLGFNWIAVL